MQICLHFLVLVNQAQAVVKIPPLKYAAFDNRLILSIPSSSPSPKCSGSGALEGELGTAGETLGGTVLGMAGNTVGVLEGICWEVVKAMVGVGLEYFWEVDAACVLDGYREVVGAGVVELAVVEGRLQAGAKARWLQLLMEGSYLGKSLSRAWTIQQRAPGACRTQVSVALSRACAPKKGGA